MFEQFGMLVNTAILLASLIALNKASEVTIDNSIKVADLTGLGKTTVGFLLISFSTSLPELSVSVISTLGGGAIGIAIGNVLGSNIVNICLIMGVCFLLLTIKNSDGKKVPTVLGKDEQRSLYFGLFVASLIPLVLIYIGYASRFIGAILLAIFAFYNFQLIKKRDIKAERPSKGDKSELRRPTLFTFLGAMGVVVSAYFITDSASYIALTIGIPPVIIGATIIAFGTSLPELVTSISATRRGHLDLALGNVVGSGFVNTTLILGVALIGSTLRIDMIAFSNLIMFSIMTNLFLWYFLTGDRISWRESAVLLFMYIFFLAVSFGLPSF